MRSAVLILLPIVLLAGIFYVVIIRGRPAPPTDLLAQVGAQPKTREMVPSTVPSIDPNASVVGQSANVWVETLNKKTHLLANEFRAQQTNPRPDGDVDVVYPQARFYGENSGIVTLEGIRGRVSLSKPGSPNDPQALGNATPTEGVLEDVTLRFYDASLDEEPSMVMQLPKVHFDAIGNRVNTVDCVIDGKGVLAEQVPVTMRGRDYDFDGFGLAMRWNDRDGRLDSLEINRGQRLLIKDPDHFGLGLGPTTQPAAPALVPTPTAAISVGDIFFGVVAAPPASTAPAAPRKAQLYHATFDHDVRVMQDGKQIAAGDAMRVVLPMGEEHAPRAEPPPVIESDKAHREKKKAAATAPILELVDRPDVAPTTAPLKPAPTTKRAATATRPTTQPASPITVLWDGPLTVRPVELVSKDLRDKMVELVGAPAWVEENGSRADARLIHAEPDLGKYRLEPGGSVKSIAVHDASGAELRSHNALFVDRSVGVANVNGGGTLTTQGTATQPDPTTVTWSRRMTLGMTTGENSYIKRAVIEGNADVTNRQLKVNSETLTLGFAPPQTPTTKSTTNPATAPATIPATAPATLPATAPSTRPARSANMSMPTADMNALRTVVATGGARMEIGVDDARRVLAAKNIHLGFVAGTPGNAALETVKCDEDVTLDDAKGFALACANLDAKLKPTDLNHPEPQSDADPLANIDRLLATGSVAIKQADGSTGTGDRLELEGQDESKRMTLTGIPARAASARGALEGGRILFNPSSGDVNVPGPGQFLGTGDAKQPDSTMTVAWAESMASNTKTGVCDLAGGVKINGNNPDGTQLHATAETGHILFSTTQPTTKPTTQSTTQSTTQAASEPASMPTSDPTSSTTSKPTSKLSTRATTRNSSPLSGLSASSIRFVRLHGAVDVAMDEYEVRTSTLQSEQLDIDLDRGTVTAPEPGRLLVLDRRPQATTRPSKHSTSQPTSEPTSEPTSQPDTRPVPTEVKPTLTPAVTPSLATTAPATEASSEPTTESTSQPTTQRTGGLNNGSLAIAWKHTMLWKMHEGILTFDGGVRMGYERTGTNDPIRIDSDHVICSLAPVETAQGIQQVSKIELHTVTAEQDVSVRSKETSFDSTSLAFDVPTGRATAYGDEQTPVEMFDADGTSRVGFSSVTWNLQTGLIEDFQDVQGRLNR